MRRAAAAPLLALLLGSEPIRTSAFRKPRTEPKTPCDITVYDCPSHYFCARDYAQKAPHLGICRCNPFYGFYGPHCQTLSVTSYVFASLNGVVLLLSCYAFWLNATAVRTLVLAGAFRFNATGRTLFCNLVGNIPVMSVATGLSVTSLNIDKRMFYHRFMREGSVAAYFGLFILYCLSISLVSSAVSPCA